IGSSLGEETAVRGSRFVPLDDSYHRLMQDKLAVLVLGAFPPVFVSLLAFLGAFDLLEVLVALELPHLAADGDLHGLLDLPHGAGGGQREDGGLDVETVKCLHRADDAGNFGALLGVSEVLECRVVASATRPVATGSVFDDALGDPLAVDAALGGLDEACKHMHRRRVEIEYSSAVDREEVPQTNGSIGRATAPLRLINDETVADLRAEPLAEVNCFRGAGTKVQFWRNTVDI